MTWRRISMRACSVRATAFSATRWSFSATAPAMFWSRMVRSVARLCGALPTWVPGAARPRASSAWALVRPRWYSCTSSLAASRAKRRSSILARSAAYSSGVSMLEPPVTLRSSLAWAFSSSVSCSCTYSCRFSRLCRRWLMSRASLVVNPSAAAPSWTKRLRRFMATAPIDCPRCELAAATATGAGGCAGLNIVGTMAVGFSCSMSGVAVSRTGAGAGSSTCGSG